MFNFVHTLLVPLVPLALKIAGIILTLILLVAYLTYAERRVIGAMQLRCGPNVTGPFGLLQPIADALKLLWKETVIPTPANPVLFIGAPVATFTISLIAWAVIPVADQWVLSNINAGVLYILAVSSLGVYGILVAGWASNSKYAFLGALRACAQMISYELTLGLIVVCVLMLSGSMNLTEIVQAQRGLWFVIPLFPLFFLFFACILAETNRAPFDLPEAESELVAGFHVEYAGMLFGLFFLAEYANMILMSAFTTILFLGGWLPPVDIAPLNMIPGIIWFAGKVAFLLFCFLWVRATLPRYRYDQLMRLGWKVFLPLALAGVVIVALVLRLRAGL